MARMYNPAHPGEVLKDGVFSTGLSVTEAAKQLRVSRVQLSRLLNGKAGISADMALRLAAWLGGSAKSWMQMQANYDLWRAEKRRRPKIAKFKAAA